MKKKTMSLAAVVAFVLGFALSGAMAATPELVTPRSPLFEPPVTGGGDSANSIVTPDGRFVLFASTANNLATNSNGDSYRSQSPAKMNVFLRDRSNATTILVSVNLAGSGGGNGDSMCTGLSTNGRYALFESSASDLISGDTNKTADIFLRDVVNGTTTLVSVGTSGGVANGESRDPVMTPDGRYVAFVSFANNLVPNDTNGIADVFVRDLVAGTTVLASEGAARSPVFHDQTRSDSPAITPDGRRVVFTSTAANLGPLTTNYGEIYVRDLITATTIVVSSGAHSVVTNDIRCYDPVISDDGEFVAFEVTRYNVNIVAPPTGEVWRMIFRYAVQSDVLEPVSSIPVVGGSPYFQNVDMTPDGRFIAFTGEPDSGSGTRTSSVYVWDALGGTTTLVSADLNGAVVTNAECQSPGIDVSGRFISFLSTATNLTTNAVFGTEPHLFVRDRLNGTTRLVDIGTNGVGAAKSIWSASAPTPDGRFIAFDCTDSDIVVGDHNGGCDAFLQDLIANTTELTSVRMPNLPDITAAGSSGSSPGSFLHSGSWGLLPRQKGIPAMGVSDNGRYLAFASDAPDLAAGDTNRVRDIFVRDLQLGTNILVSADTNGLAPAKGFSTLPAISADGRYVVFCSTASSLVAGDTNRYQDVFVRDLTAGTTTLVSVSTNGINSGDGDSVLLSLSADGRFVLFASPARNLTTNVLTSPLGCFNLFRRDLELGTTIAITTSNQTTLPLTAFMSRDGQVVVFEFYGPPLGKLYEWTPLSTTLIKTGLFMDYGILESLSSDGRRIAFSDGSSFSEPGVLRIRDLIANTNVVVGPSIRAIPFFHMDPQFNSDGRFLVYATGVNISVLDHNGAADIYLYDFDARTNLLISRSFSSGFTPNRLSDSPTISPDGRFVVYRSFATDIIPTVTNGTAQTYLYDRQTDTTILVGPGAFGGSAVSCRAQNPIFSGDSQTLVFSSWASDIIFFDFNQFADVFSWKLAETNAIPVFSGQMVYAPTSGKSPTLTWPVVSGKSYQVQFKNNLIDPVWQPLSGTVTVVGDRGYATDLAPSPDQRFYRILAY